MACYLSKQALCERLHQHEFRNEDQARLVKHGELDCELLRAAGLKVDPELSSQAVLRVAFDAVCLNVYLGRAEPVFQVFAPAGHFSGHYFASAFKSLTP
jgi:hypothetical protein